MSKERMSGENLARATEDFANCYGTSEFKVFAATITNSHRTLQQSVFGLFMLCIERWAQAAQDGCFDDRNKYTCEMARDMLAAVKDRWHGRPPMI